MLPDFDQQLQERLIRYFLKYHGLTISNEQADEFLDSMGEFCLWFNKSVERRTLPEAADPLPDS